MRSRLYVGQLMHARRAPVEHAFRYPAFAFALDVDELPRLSDTLRLFGHDRRALFALHEADYLGAGAGDLRTRLARRIAQAGCAIELARIELLTVPRVFGHAFNPVSFFYCRDAADELSGVVVEVNNTFGEAHVYVLPADAPMRARKHFHVSPFHDMNGEYAFRFADLGERLDIGIDLQRDGTTTFVSRLWGGARPLSDAQLARLAAGYPLTAALTLPRILWQAFKLHYRKDLPVFAKPEPSSPQTYSATRPSYIREFAAPRVAQTNGGRRASGSGPWSPLARASRRVVTGYLERLRHGCIELRLPDEATTTFGDGHASRRATLAVNHPRFFFRTLAGGDLGFAESYIDGDWDSDDLATLIEIFAANRAELDDLSPATALPRRLLNRAYHRTRRNTLAGNRRNIEDHYDLGNEFFALFLDPSMTYSCAVFPAGNESLAEAQQLKLETILDKCELRPGDRLLEIGSGWGSLALAAARRGCRVTTLTLSEQQRRLVAERAAAAGLQRRIDVRVADYREIEGAFDRIVSVEMLEAVGHENLPRYFAACERLLRPGGRAVIQVITIRDELYDDYRRGCDFIQRHIFPGGHLPCWSALREAICAAPSLAIDNVEDIGHHYPGTLRAWATALQRNADRARQLGFDAAFLRKWNYYFRYCEAGFRARLLGDLQIVLSKQPSDPATR